MTRFFKTAVLSLAVAATIVAALPTAHAGDRNWRHHHGGHGRYHSNGADVAAAGILGLAAGALVVGLSAHNNPEPVYDDYYRAPPVREYPRTVYYGGSFEPWSRSWYEYCSDRYRSFDPDTGTFMGYDGREHFCVAN